MLIAMLLIGPWKGCRVHTLLAGATAALLLVLAQLCIVGVTLLLMIAGMTHSSRCSAGLPIAI